MPTQVSPSTARAFRVRRLLDFTVLRIVIAVFATALAGGLTAQFVSDHTQGRLHDGWPSLCGSVAALLAYAAYVRLIERRRAFELAPRAALQELFGGLVVGAALVGLVMGGLMSIGLVRWTAIAPNVGSLAVAFAQMTFVGVFEELLMRAILLRLIERSLGTWMALALSSLLFGIAHAPGDGAGVLPLAIAVVAGAFFGAAYLATRRVWLCIALHTGWNFTLGSVFAMAVSGRELHPGLFVGTLDGPQWLTGGSYGPEGSALTLVVLFGAGAVLLRRAIARRHMVAWPARQAAS